MSSLRGYFESSFDQYTNTYTNYDNNLYNNLINIDMNNIRRQLAGTQNFNSPNWIGIFVVGSITILWCLKFCIIPNCKKLHHYCTKRRVRNHLDGFDEEGMFCYIVILLCVMCYAQHFPFHFPFHFAVHVCLFLCIYSHMLLHYLI